MPVNSPLKLHGGKFYLARKIVPLLMPRHRHYVEPFGGTLAVLLYRDPDDPRFWIGTNGSQRGVSELASDIHSPLMNFWRVLRDEETFQKFKRIVDCIPLSHSEWEEARDHEYGDDAVADAVAFFVFCRQSLAGRMKGWTSITRNRLRAGMNGNGSEWRSAVDGLPVVHERLRRVVLDNKPALEIIQREDGPDVLHYLDPPYPVHSKASKNGYEFEMTDADHRELLDTVKQIKGKAMVSTYPSPLYEQALVSWNRHTFDVPNNESGEKIKNRKTEVVWCNY
jgi:DNA adenine methylase